MIGYSLMQDPGRYSLSGLDIYKSVMTSLSGVSFAQRHLSLANRILGEDGEFSTKALRFSWHVTVGIIELAPIVGGVVALVEKVFARVFFGQKAGKPYHWLGSAILSSYDPRGLIEAVGSEDLIVLTHVIQNSDTASFYWAMTNYFSARRGILGLTMNETQLNDLNGRLDLVDAFFERDRIEGGALFPNESSQVSMLQSLVGASAQRLLNAAEGRAFDSPELGLSAPQRAFIQREVEFLKRLNRNLKQRLIVLSRNEGAAHFVDVGDPTALAEDPFVSASNQMISDPELPNAS